MRQIKTTLMSEQVLKYFDVNQDAIIQTDASKGGLGAVLLQLSHPVANPSRALNNAEQIYPQIDNGLLAIVYGCEKFHTYTYGRDIAIQTSTTCVNSEETIMDGLTTAAKTCICYCH